MEYEDNKQKEILITERTDITPFLGMDWMKKIQTDNRENTSNRN